MVAGSPLGEPVRLVAMELLRVLVGEEDEAPATEVVADAV